VKITAPIRPSRYIMPTVRRTLRRSRVPQNWERKTEAPELMPKQTRLRMKKI
jgi:hypothetical protein